MKKIITNILYSFLFIILLIFSTVFIAKNKTFNISKTIKSIKNIDTANVNLFITKNYKINEDEEKVNFIYKFNFNKNYSDNKYKEVLATDGNIGMEIESLNLGVYVPIKTIISNDNIESYMKIDDVYKELFTLNKNLIYFNYNDFYDKKGSFENLLQIKNIYQKSFIDFLIKHKKDFKYIKSNKQTILSGCIGNLSISLDENDLKDLIDIINTNFNNNEFKNTENYKKVNNFINNLTKKENLNISVDIYGNHIKTIKISNNDLNILIDISNINNKNYINIDDLNDNITFFNFIKENKDNILSIIGKSASNDVSTNLGYFKSKYNEISMLMKDVINYSDIGNFDFANIKLDKIDEVIDEMNEKKLNSNDNSLSEIDYNNWIELFKELKNYSFLYKESCQNKENKEIDNKLNESINNLNGILNKLNIKLT